MHKGRLNALFDYVVWLVIYTHIYRERERERVLFCVLLIVFAFWCPLHPSYVLICIVFFAIYIHLVFSIKRKFWCPLHPSYVLRCIVFFAICIHLVFSIKRNFWCPLHPSYVLRCFVFFAICIHLVFSIKRKLCHLLRYAGVYQKLINTFPVSKRDSRLDE